MKRWHPYQLLATVWTVGILAIAASLVASYLYEKDVRALWLPYTPWLLLALLAGGYLTEIEKMHAEVMAYLSRHASESAPAEAA